MNRRNFFRKAATVAAVSPVLVGGLLSMPPATSAHASVPVTTTEKTDLLLARAAHPLPQVQAGTIMKTDTINQLIVRSNLAMDQLAHMHKAGYIPFSEFRRRAYGESLTN